MNDEKHPVGINIKSRGGAGGKFFYLCFFFLSFCSEFMPWFGQMGLASFGIFIRISWHVVVHPGCMEA